jgi:hypothetical protein
MWMWNIPHLEEVRKPLHPASVARRGEQAPQRFVDDVRDDKPGVYKAEYIEGTTPNL